MERVQLHCNFSFIYYLDDSTHLNVQNPHETMEFMVIKNIRLII